MDLHRRTLVLLLASFIGLAPLSHGQLPKDAARGLAPRNPGPFLPYGIQTSYSVNGYNPVVCAVGVQNNVGCNLLIGLTAAYNGTSNSPGSLTGPQVSLNFLILYSDYQLTSLELWVASPNFNVPSGQGGAVLTSDLAGTITSGTGSFDLTSCVDTTNGLAPPTTAFCGAGFSLSNNQVVFSQSGGVSSHASTPVSSLSAPYSLSQHLSIKLSPGSWVSVTVTATLTGGVLPGTGSLTIDSTQPQATFAISPAISNSPTRGPFPVTIPNVAPGLYTVKFGDISGTITPLTQTKQVNPGDIVPFTGSYQALPATAVTTSLGASPYVPAHLASEPVNTSTGNYFSTHNDLTVPGRGFPLAFTRSYSSEDSYNGPLGPGWTHSYNLRLVQNPDASVAIKQADGSVIGFVLSGGNYVASTKGVFDTLIANSDGSFTLTRKNQMKLNFSAAGRLASVVDRNGNAQSFAYDSLNNLTTITDSSSRAYALAYDNNSHLTTLTDVAGRKLQYTYDTAGHLSSFTDTTGATTSYAYDANNRMISATDAKGNVYMQNTYDSQGRVVTQKNARNFTTTFAYDTPTAGTTTYVDPLGNSTEDIYDSSGRFVEMVDATGAATTFVYDANNLKLSSTDPLGRIQKFTYDPLGNILSATDATGKSSSFTYDGQNNLLTVKDRLGRTTSFSYDGTGNMLNALDPAGNQSSFTYDSTGEVLTAKNPRGFVTAFQYDTAGNLNKVTDALGGTATMAYDGVGRLVSVQNQLGKTATRVYDAANRLLSVIDPLNNSTTFQYDPNGNLTKITDANGAQTQYSYDATNKLAQVTDAIGGITQYQYNGNTDLTAVIDAAGHATNYTYDPLRRLAMTTDPLGRQKRYGYDAAGNVVSTLDGNGKTNTFGYDSLNRLLSMALSDGKSVAYSYDAVGNRTGMVDWRGASSYAYDVLNRVTSVATPDGKTVGYAYDAVGNRTALTYPDGRVAQYAYDALNRLSKVTDWAAKSTTYSYDALGNLTGFAHPNGATSAYQYDIANRLTSIVNRSGSSVLSSFTYGLDKVGNRLQMTTSAGGINKYGYDPLYRLTSWTAPSGQMTQWSYDAVGNRKSMISPAGTTSYTYDAADQMLTAGAATLTYDGNGNQLTKTTSGITTTYGWDALNRLTSVTGGSVNTQYRYDGDGNRVSQQVPAGTYAYVIDPVIGLTVVLNEVGPDGNIDYVFGNSVISANSASYQYFHQYDGLGSTINLTDSVGSPKASYSYDPWGKLILPFDPIGTKDKYKYISEPLDADTGLSFLRERYYDSTVGRFVSRDGDPGDLLAPMTENSYLYGLDNSMRLVDHSGLSAVDGPSHTQPLQPVQIPSIEIQPNSSKGVRMAVYRSPGYYYRLQSHNVHTPALPDSEDPYALVSTDTVAAACAPGVAYAVGTSSQVAGVGVGTFCGAFAVGNILFGGFFK